MSRIWGESGCMQWRVYKSLSKGNHNYCSRTCRNWTPWSVVAGHQSMDTIRQHVKDPSMDQRANMSKILHDYGSSSSTGLEVCPANTEETLTASTSTESIGGAVSSTNSENALVPQTLKCLSKSELDKSSEFIAVWKQFYGTVNVSLNSWFWRMRTLLFQRTYVLMGFI